MQIYFFFTENQNFIMTKKKTLVEFFSGFNFYQIHDNFKPHSIIMTIEDSNTNTNSSSSTTVEKSTLSTSILPPLHFTIHWLKPILYLLFLLICNVAIPCLLYYLLLTYTSLSEQGAIGIASASLGISSCFDSPFRLYRCELS